jgi:membrane protein YdbS with pleckstrin-like domain
MGLLKSIFTPAIGKHLLRDEEHDEVIVDVVEHHWVAYWVPMIEAVVAGGLLVLVAVGPASFSIAPLVVAAALVAHAMWGTLVVSRDRFVITNLRVFRISGVLAQKRAIMPMMRILDITVQQPLIGRLCGFGHFTFESAAQEQGLRDIRYVGRPDERDKTIQRLVAMRGLRPSKQG